MAHVFSGSMAVDMLVFDSSTRYTEHPWRHPRDKRRKKVTAKTDASTRQKKETKKKKRKNIVFCFPGLYFSQCFPEENILTKKKKTKN